VATVQRLGWWLEDHALAAAMLLVTMAAASLLLSARALRRSCKRPHRLSPDRRTVWMFGAACSSVGSAALLALLLAGVSKAWPELRRQASIVGRALPELRYERLPDRRSSTIAELRGKVLLLSLWAPWCKPCLEEMPQLARLQERYRSAGLVVLEVSLDPPERLAGFVKSPSEGPTFGHLESRGSLPIPSLPSTFLFDQQGVIRKAWRGAQPYERLAAAVQEML
jgi:thiol-disulfide isomerase/thioredoxin